MDLLTGQLVGGSGAAGGVSYDTSIAAIIVDKRLSQAQLL
jgi:hypothetical protein